MIDIVAEKRSQGRMLTAVTGRASVEYSPDSTLTVGDTLICQTREMSLAGMCLLSQQLIPPHTRLLLEVQVGSADNVFRHRAVVIWCRDAGEGYLVGLHIMESMCDEQNWKHTVINLLVG